MKTEEKAKAYDEALETARQIHNGNPSSGTAIVVCEQIFPELAESEDKRIIQFFAELATDACGGQGQEYYEELGLNYDKVMAWLEKQKEPLPIPDKFSGLKSLMLQYLQSAANRKDDSEIENDTDLWGRKILDFVWKYSDEQKEQKPWKVGANAYFTPDSECCNTTTGRTNDESEYDKGYREGKSYQLKQTEQYQIGKTFMGLIPCWVNAPSELQPAHKYHERNAVIMHENNGGFRCCFIDDEKATTIHLPEDTLFVEGWRKKPAEWSEGDEEMRNLIVSIFDVNHPNGFFKANELGTTDMRGVHTEEITSWLKSLPLNLKKKNEDVAKLCSNEWSEKDEECRKEIIEYIEQRLGDGTSGQALWKKWHSWLKSIPERFVLEPKQEWSEEDEKNLELVTDCVYEFYPDPVMKYKLKDWLKSLRPQKLDASKLENFDPVDVLNRIKTEWPMAWEKIVGKSEWSDEKKNKIESIKTLVTTGRFADINTIKTIWELLDSLRPQPKDETYKEKDEAFKLGKHQLALSFMNYLDENRPEGKMSLSNGECEDIDKAFKENDWAKILRYAEKYGRRD